MVDCTAIDGQKANQLIETMHTILKEHKVLTYSEVWTYNSKIDIDARGYIVDMYSDCKLTTAKNCTNESYDESEPCMCFSREHSLPKSWWGGSDSEPMYTDVVHVIPSDNAANGERSYYPYGEPNKSSITWSNSVGAKLGQNSAYGSNGYVFYPNPDYRGDIARIYFYMITCYRDKNFTSNAQARRVMQYSNGVASFKSNFLNVLLKWHREDPVSDWEKTRNKRIEKQQGNRNPFVDYPELVEYVWGTKVGQTYVCTTDIDDVPLQTVHPKILRNGHLYIECNHTIYNILGKSIKQL